MEPYILHDYEHAPTHLFVPGATYMLTASTRKKRRTLDTDEKKTQVIRFLWEVAGEKAWTLIAWVVLDNHYHAMLRAHDSEESVHSIARFCKELHRRISISVNHLDKVKGRCVMENYWDRCVSYERSYWARLNYIHHNPVKHGYVQYAADYPFGSCYYAQRDQWNELEKQYPWDRVNEEDDF